MAKKKKAKQLGVYEKLLQHQKKIMGIVSIVLVLSLLLSVLAQFFTALV